MKNHKSKQLNLFLITIFIFVGNYNILFAQKIIKENIEQKAKNTKKFQNVSASINFDNAITKEKIIEPEIYSEVNKKANSKTKINSKLLITSEGFESAVPPAGWTQWQEIGTNNWAQTSSRANSGTYSAFFDDFSGDNEVWLISNSIDLNSYNNEVVSYYENVNYGSWADQHNVLISTDYSGSGDPNLADWTDLSDQAYFSTGDYTWVESGTIDLSSITGNEITFAFKYTCGTESETWQLDDINITGTAVGVGIEDDIAFQSISVYPNPAKEWIQLKGTVSPNSKLVIYNYLGQVELEQNVNSNDKLNISFLNSGVYILQLKDMDSDVQNFRLIIQ